MRILGLILRVITPFLLFLFFVLGEYDEDEDDDDERHEEAVDISETEESELLLMTVFKAFSSACWPTTLDKRSGVSTRKWRKGYHRQHRHRLWWATKATENLLSINSVNAGVL